MLYSQFVNRLSAGVFGIHKTKLLSKGSKKAAWNIIDEYFHFMGIEY
jgi:hypothetical protein